SKGGRELSDPCGRHTDLKASGANPPDRNPGLPQNLHGIQPVPSKPRDFFTSAGRYESLANSRRVDRLRKELTVSPRCPATRSMRSASVPLNWTPRIFLRIQGSSKNT